MAIEETLSELIKHVNTSPFLFMGTGLSIRYLGAQSWEGLLRDLARKTRQNEYAFEQFRESAKAEVANEKNVLFPKIASLIEREFNQIWLSNSEYAHKRTIYKHCIQQGISPMKIEISDYLRELTLLNSQNAFLVEEINSLRKIGEKSISGIITTNYDNLLENIFSEYTSYIGQSQLIFSPIQGIAEIYKIHGCCSEPGTIIINEDDYQNFNDHNAYLSAKLLTIFLEHPVIFIGYSLNDDNIRKILSSISFCLSQEQLSELRNRLIFVEWNNTDQPDAVTPYSISFENSKSIEMTRIFVNDYRKIYNVLLNSKVKSRYSVSLLRKLKKDIFDLVLSNDPSGNLKVISPFSKYTNCSNDVFEYVIGVGVSHEFGIKGLIGICAEDVFRDIVFDDFAEYPDFDLELFVTKALPELLSRNTNSIPIYKYIKLALESGMARENIPNTVQSLIKDDLDGLLSNTIRKDKLRLRRIVHGATVNTLRSDFDDMKCLYLICLLDQDNIDIDDLHSFLAETLTKYSTILSKDNPDNYKDNYRTDLRRLIKIYDWLNYH